MKKEISHEEVINWEDHQIMVEHLINLSGLIVEEVH